MHTCLICKNIYTTDQNYIAHMLKYHKKQLDNTNLPEWEKVS